MNNTMKIIALLPTFTIFPLFVIYCLVVGEYQVATFLVLFEFFALWLTFSLPGFLQKKE